MRGRPTKNDLLLAYPTSVLSLLLEYPRKEKRFRWSTSSFGNLGSMMGDCKLFVCVLRNISSSDKEEGPGSGVSESRCKDATVGGRT